MENPPADDGDNSNSDKPNQPNWALYRELHKIFFNAKYEQNYNKMAAIHKSALGEIDTISKYSSYRLFIGS